MTRTHLIVEVPDPMSGRVIQKRMVMDGAEASDLTTPPFVTNRPGSKPYFGHPLLADTRVDGWCLGVVTDPFEPDCDVGCSIGDAFVEAPDGSRAGLVWTVHDELRFGIITEPDRSRWGVFHFTVPRPISNMEQLADAFARMVPTLRALHDRYTGQGVDSAEPPDQPT